MADGWLAFQGLRERRRLAPVPQNWTEMTAAELCRLLEVAESGRPQTH